MERVGTTTVATGIATVDCPATVHDHHRRANRESTAVGAMPASRELAAGPLDPDFLPVAEHPDRLVVGGFEGALTDGVPAGLLA